MKNILNPWNKENKRLHVFFYVYLYYIYFKKGMNTCDLCVIIHI